MLYNRSHTSLTLRICNNHPYVHGILSHLGEDPQMFSLFINKCLSLDMSKESDLQRSGRQRFEREIRVEEKD